MLLLVLCISSSAASWAAPPALPAKPANLIYDELGSLSQDRASLLKLQAAAGRRGVDVGVLVVRDWHRWASSSVSDFGKQVIASWRLRPRATVLVVCPGRSEARIVLDDTWEPGWSQWGDYIVEQRVRPALERGKVSGAVVNATDSLVELSKIEPGATAPEMSPSFHVDQFAARWGRWTWFRSGWFVTLFTIAIVLLTVGASFTSVRPACVLAGAWLLALDLYAPLALFALIAWLIFTIATGRSLVPKQAPKERPPLYL